MDAEPENESRSVPINSMPKSVLFALLGMALLAVSFLVGGLLFQGEFERRERFLSLTLTPAAIAAAVAVAIVLPSWVSRWVGRVGAWLLVVYLLPVWALGAVFAFIGIRENPLMLLPLLAVTIPFGVAVSSAMAFWSPSASPWFARQR